MASARDETLVRKFRNRLRQRISFDPSTFGPSCVYHYTSAAGFAGILNDGAIRATNFSFLNDPFEVRHGTDLARQLLGEIRESVPHLKKSMIDDVLTSLNLKAATEVYVSCFTRLPDDPRLWCDYGSAAVERYAIGFDPRGLETLGAPPHIEDENEREREEPNTNFAEVLYDKADQIERIRFFLDRAFEFIDSESVKQQQWRALAGEVAQRIARVLPELKDLAYKNEQEWRIVRWHAREDQPPEVHESQGVLRPFLKVDLPSPLPIVALRVMAPARKEQALKAANMLLRRANVVGVNATPSGITFAE